MRLILAFTTGCLATDIRAQTSDAYADLTGNLIFGTSEPAPHLLAQIRERGAPDAAASLILAP